VQPDADLDFAPAVVASIVAGYVSRADQSELLLLGCRSGPGDSGTVPFLVAEALGWPCLTQVTEISPLTDHRVRVTCTADDGLLRLTVPLPCVLAVGNAAVSRLRVPTLKDRLAHKDARFDVLGALDLGVDVTTGLAGETCVLTELEPIVRTRRGVVIGGETPREKAQLLFDSHLKGILETI